MNTARRIRSLIAIICYSLTAFVIVASPTASALSKNDLESIYRDSVWYRGGGSQCLSSVNASSPGSNDLEGHKLPAYKGGTGNEEQINSDGTIGVTHHGVVAFTTLVHNMVAKKGESGAQPYLDYAINMRWLSHDYYWTSDERKGGHLPIPNAAHAGEDQWFESGNDATPRLIIVTNPENGKSIIAAALEAGPAPFTGTGLPEEMPPPYWQGAVNGTPDLSTGYKGRVSGLTPKAISALGGSVQRETRGTTVTGPDLVYAWAPDQNATPGPTTSSSGGGAGCAASACTPGGGGVGDGKTVAIDPGHSPFDDPSSRNTLTGLYDNETSGADGEAHNAWVAAGKIKDKLTTKGYNVFVTKNSENESFNLSQRAERANSSGASLLFTLHADSDARWLAYPDEKSTRVPKNDTRRDGTDGLVHPEIIAPSKAFAEKMAPIIASKIDSSYHATSFYDYYGPNGLEGNGLNPGNTPVQTILSSVPEVYSEVAVSDLASDTFTDAVVDAISQAMPISGGQVAAGAVSDVASSSGCDKISALLQTIEKYAWPDYRKAGSPEALVMKPEYEAAIKQASTAGKYIGGTNYPGIDCGGFVTRAMQDSLADPKYNDEPPDRKGPTQYQLRYLQDHTELYESVKPSTTGDLKPGDIGIYDDDGDGRRGHTYFFVGDGIKSWDNGYNAASSSWDERAPMASTVGSGDVGGGTNYFWFRLK